MRKRGGIEQGDDLAGGLERAVDAAQKIGDDVWRGGQLAVVEKLGEDGGQQHVVGQVEFDGGRALHPAGKVGQSEVPVFGRRAGRQQQGMALGQGQVVQMEQSRFSGFVAGDGLAILDRHMGAGEGGDIGLGQVAGGHDAGAALRRPDMGEMRLARAGRAVQHQLAGGPAFPRVDQGHGLCVGGGNEEILPPVSRFGGQVEAELLCHYSGSRSPCP